MKPFLPSLIITLLFIYGCADTEDVSRGTHQSQGIAFERMISWSGDGSKIVYISSNAIIVRDVLADRSYQLTGTGFYDEPVWSPDSTRIAYTLATYTSRADIWVKNADGSGIAKRITSDFAADVHPRWSPDGMWICFQSYRKKSMDIWLKRSDGSGEDLPIVSDPSTDQNAEWSPDGSLIAFESNRSGNFDIWTLNIKDTSIIRQITAAKSSETNPSWSPDGKKISFISDRTGIKSLWVKRSDGTGDEVLISEGYGNVTFHRWSPDGRWLGFIADNKIIVRSSDGSGEGIELDEGTEFCWSPDCKRIAYISTENNQYKVKFVEFSP